MANSNSSPGGSPSLTARLPSYPATAILPLQQYDRRALEAGAGELAEPGLGRYPQRSEIVRFDQAGDAFARKPLRAPAYQRADRFGGETLAMGFRPKRPAGFQRAFDAGLQHPPQFVKTGFTYQPTRCFFLDGPEAESHDLPHAGMAQ